MKLKLFASSALLATILYGQALDAPAGDAAAQQSSSNQNPIFRVQVVSRSVQAVSYRNRSGWTKVDFQGTAIAPKAKGSAEVNGRSGYLQVKTDIKSLPAAATFGPEFLTYVIWAITPDGKSSNLGEVKVDKDGNAKLDVTTELQSFGLIVTAEPYFAVALPSEVVVMENVVRKDTMGKVEAIDAKYELLPRGQYIFNVPESQMKAMQVDSKTPLEFYEAQNALQIARYAKADEFGGSTFQDAQKLLNQAEDYITRKAGSKPVIMTSREAVQKAEDARVISLRKQQQLALENERKMAADRVARSKQAAEAAAAQQQAAEQQAKLEEQRRAEAEQARLQADQARNEAEQARAQAAAEAEKARIAAAEADKLRQQAVADKEALRAQLLQQFNTVLDTRETPRGLVVNMNDVLFATGKYDLKDAAREKLSKISGIIISHPGLNLQVEGHTDITGSDELNQKLSQQRADTVREYLIKQGINQNDITAQGLGKSDPIASNDTPSGRQLNRRVELVVSGEVIGTRIGGTPTTQLSTPQTQAAPVVAAPHQ